MIGQIRFILNQFINFIADTCRQHLVQLWGNIKVENACVMITDQFWLQWKIIIIVFPAALQEILAALTGGEVVEALESARETAGNDMVALMTRVFPLVTQVTTKVISNYGFTQDGVGKLRKLSSKHAHLNENYILVDQLADISSALILFSEIAHQCILVSINSCHLPKFLEDIVSHDLLLMSFFH